MYKTLKVWKCAERQRSFTMLFAALFAMLEDGIISYYNASMLLKMKEMITQIAVLRRPPSEMSEASFFL